MQASVVADKVVIILVGFKVDQLENIVTSAVEGFIPMPHHVNVGQLKLPTQVAGRGKPLGLGKIPLWLVKLVEDVIAKVVVLISSVGVSHVEYMNGFCVIISFLESVVPDFLGCHVIVGQDITVIVEVVHLDAKRIAAILVVVNVDSFHVT